MIETNESNTSKYEYIELFDGLARNLQTRNNVSFSSQEETPVKVILFKGDTGSTFMIRRLRQGISRSGIPWSKWEMWGKVNVSFRAIGKSPAKLNVYGMYRLTQGNAQRWQPFQNITPRSDFLHTIVPYDYIHAFNEEVERLYTKNIGKAPISALSYKEHFMGDATSKKRPDQFIYASHLAYPLIRELFVGNTAYRGAVISGISAALRSETIMDATKVLYGVSNYRKDLVRAVAKSSFMTMAITHQLRNLVPIDWIIKLMQEWNTKSGMDINAAERVALRPFFKTLTMTQRKRLIDEILKSPHTMWIVSETIRLFGILFKDHEVNFQQGQVAGRSWREIHDFFMTDIQIRGAKEKPIEKVSLAKKISEIPSNDDFALVLPDTTADLITWGRDMGHCIGSYTNNAVKGSDVFVGIMQKGAMIGNAQIRTSGKQVVQMFGKRNTILDESVQQKFSELLINEKILSEHSFLNTYGWTKSMV